MHTLPSFAIFFFNSKLEKTRRRKLINSFPIEKVMPTTRYISMDFFKKGYVHINKQDNRKCPTN